MQDWRWVGPVPQNENITEKRVREGEFRPFTIATVGACCSCTSSYALLPFSGKVAIGEMVGVKALMGSIVGAIKDGEGGAR